MTFVETGGLCKKESVFFLNFYPYFFILSQFQDISLCRTNEKSVFQREIKIANTKTTKKMLTECIVSVLSHNTGIIACRVKEKLQCTQNELYLSNKFYHHLTLDVFTSVRPEKN